MTDSLANQQQAQQFHEQAQVLSDEGRDDDAIVMYQKAIELDPEKSESFYNIGLIYKYRGEWQLSLDYSKRANELCPEDEAARWNLAIAATALRQWDVARTAWAQSGIKLDGNAGPIDMDFGMTPVRLNPEGSAEVVWATRIDPVRARIDSIPYVKSGYRHGDIVLHDGAPVGYRKAGEREYPVFNVLELFEASDYRTSVAGVEIAKDEDLDVLTEIFSETPHGFEDWTVNIMSLCKQCSEGLPHEHHDAGLEKVWSPERTLGLAICGGDDVSPLFDEWHKRTGAQLLEIN